MSMKTTPLFIYLFLTATLWLVACSGQSDRKVLDKAFKLVDRYPDSAAWLLENKIIPASLTDEEKANYWYFLTVAHAYQGRSMINDSLIAYSVAYYRKHNDLHHLFNACRFAYWQTSDKKQKEAYLLEAIEVAKEKESKDFLENAYNMLAYFYYDERDYQKTIDACRQWEAVSSGNKESAWYTLGLNYSRMGETDSSLYYLSRASKLAYEKKSSQAFHYMLNYISVLSKSNPRQALKEYRLMQQAFPNQTFFGITADIWLKLREKDSADYYLSILENGRMVDPDPWYITQIVLTKARRAYWETLNGNPLDLSELAQFVDSTSLATNDLMLDEKERAFMQNKLQIDNLRIESKRQQIQIAFFALLFLFTVIGSATLFYIRNRRDKLLATEEKLDALHQLLQEATSSTGAGKDDSSVLPDSRFFRKVLLQQLGIIRLVATSPTQQNKLLLQQMANIANEQTVTESLLIWDDLYPIIDHVYDHFYSRLLKLASGRLSEKELQLCCLLCAGFSTKEISVVTQQSVRTIYQRKTNIRHALGMNEKDDIIAYINAES